MRRTRVIAAAVAVSAALLAVPTVSSAAFGPLVLSGPQTIQTEGANVQSFAFTGGMNGQPGVLVVSKPADASSASLLKAAAAGTHFQQATLAWSQGTSTPSVCMRDVLVSSFKTGQGGGDTPMETVALDFAQIGYDPGGTAACAKLGPAPKATVTTSLRGGTLRALVACFSTRCDGRVSLQLPTGACARSAGLMPPDRACAGKPVDLGRIALANGSVRTLRLTVPRGRLRRALTRLGGVTTNGIIAVLRRGSGKGPPIRLRTFTGGRPVVLPEGLPAVQSAPGTATPPAGGTPPATGGGTPAPIATSLAITTCGSFGPLLREFAGSITPPVAGLTITMTYTPPSGATIQQTVTTTATGTFTDSVSITTMGNWSAQASFGGTPAYAASASPSCIFLGG